MSRSKKHPNAHKGRLGKRRCWSCSKAASLFFKWLRLTGERRR